MGPTRFTLVVAMLAGASVPAEASSIGAAAELGGKWGIVTSVHRTPAHNRAVGGVPNSFHLSGRAVDIARRPGVRHAEVEAAFRAAGYVLLESLDEGDHSHFAFDLGRGSGKTGKAVLQLASADEQAKPTCPTSLQSLLDLKTRRRPDRVDACEDAPPPTSKYKPLALAD